MGDSPVKDFFDLDMKDKMRIIESRKKLEKQLDQCMVGQFAKNVQTVIQEKAGKFKSI